MESALYKKQSSTSIINLLSQRLTGCLAPHTNETRGPRHFGELLSVTVIPPPVVLAVAAVLPGGLDF